MKKYLAFITGIVFFFAGLYMMFMPFVYYFENENTNLPFPIVYYHILSLLLFFAGGILVFWYLYKRILASFEHL